MCMQQMINKRLGTRLIMFYKIEYQIVYLNACNIYIGHAAKNSK